MPEDMSIGGLTWHSSGRDEGPDVGVSIYLGKKDGRLWCGEISKDLFDRCAGSDYFDNDGGWFIVQYCPKNITTLLAKCGCPHEARAFMDQIAAWVRAGDRQ